MLVYSGGQLKSYVTNLKSEALSLAGLSKLYERDFVDAIRKYCFNGSISKVFIVCGLRALGKTFGLLQAVEDFDDTLYLCAQQGELQAGQDYMNLLRDVHEKNIIIDEYTWIKDNHDLNYYLWTLVENGKRVVITGTHSLALDYLEDGSLIHRGFRINVNMFSYEEFCRIYQCGYSKASCIEFLKTGGLFKDHALKNYVNMDNYLQDAVISDLAQFVRLPAEEARAIVYDIMYLAVCDSCETKIKYPGARRQDEAYRNMLITFGIDPTVEITPTKFKMVSDVLEEAHFIVKTYNFYDDEEYRLHLVNPSLAYQMVSAVFDKKSADERLGKAFEAYLVTFMSTCVDTDDCLWYVDMGQQSGEPELELVIVNPNDHLAYLFDSKLREAASLPENCSLVSNKLESSLRCLGVGGRYVVDNSPAEKCGERNGKRVIFTRLDCDTLKNYRDFDENYSRIANVDKPTSYFSE